MSWLGLYQAQRGRFDPCGLDRPRKTTDQALLCGTVTLEAPFGASSEPRMLARLPWSDQTHLEIGSGPNGVVLALGDAQCGLNVDLKHGPEDIRISYMWDLVKKSASLVVEFAGLGRFVSTPAPLPACPLLTLDIRKAMAGDLMAHGDLAYLAISDQCEPCGPMPRLTAKTFLDTPFGAKPVGKLRRHDIVSTDKGQMPVLFRVTRSVPAFGRFAPIKLRAPYFGLDSDIVVSPEQRLVLSGVEIEYMFGHESVFVPAFALLAEGIAQRVKTTDFVTYHQLLLPDQGVLKTASASLESLYIGRLRRHPDALQHSIFRDVHPRHLPEHAEMRIPELRRFDAMALLAHRAA